ncbi:hypothetical protein [Neobacillus drentensis]|uniref:hypothetical protein n=1 Tax=Neobacillus drentensis TaxID=220684 RepID=UPI00285BEBD4|nr:hypothetical protein [Neobacillus drentensis]MDR7237122.1 hypothetical protein [Neobacillus drentensis]
MPTLNELDKWIFENLLDRKSWEDSKEQDIAMNQAVRNLTRWFPSVQLTAELIAYQVVWELQGLDPVLKYQKQGIKAISEGPDRIDYQTRDKVAPEIREILGQPAYEIETVVLDAGRLM